ncbi:MAG TPA: SLC13 family permease [Humisphaera sp.]
MPLSAPEGAAARPSRVPTIALLASAAVVAVMTLAAYLVSLHGDPVLKSRWPFVVVGTCVGLIIVLIAVVRLHAFLALVLAALSAGLMSPVGAFAPTAQAFKAAKFPELSPIHWVAAIELTAVEFGKTAGSIGIVVGLAAIIGICLLESGSADKVVRRFLAAFGEKRAGFALLLAAYVVSIPIFFDTLFMLLVPIAQALWLRTKKDYMLFVMVICCAGVITHSMAIPHPGPLAMLEELNRGRPAVDVGFAIIMGLASGIAVAMVGWWVCRWANRTTPAEPPAELVKPEVTASLDRPESELPSFLAAVTPVILPVLLISGASFVKAFTPKSIADQPWATAVLDWLTFLGERHVALLIGAAIAVVVLMRQKKVGLGAVANVMGGPLETAGVIILITAAGGAFGAMLRNSGVREAIKAATDGAAIDLVLLGWAVAAVIRIAQGSATVAMLTTAGIIAPLMQDQMAAGQLGYHPVYLFMAIGYGAFCCSWMNDSGFWVVSRLGGLTERQTLRSWTVLQTVDSVAGLLLTFALSKLVPMKLAAVATVAVAGT